MFQEIVTLDLYKEVLLTSKNKLIVRVLAIAATNAALSGLAMTKMSLHQNPEIATTDSATTLHQPTFSDSHPDSASLPGTQSSNDEKLDSKDLPSEVAWDGDSDPENPRNWRKAKKW